MDDVKWGKRGERPLTNPKNPDLYDALKKYFQAACEYLSDKHGESLEGGEGQEEFWISFYQGYKEDLERMEGHGKVIKIMEKDEEIVKYFDAFIELPEIGEEHRVPTAEGCLENLLRAFLRKLLKRYSLKFNESTFNRLYEEVENFFYGDTLPYQASALLYNFEAIGVESIPLEKPNLSIIKSAEPEDEADIGEGERDVEYRWYVEYCLETRKILHNHFQISEEEAFRERRPDKKFYEVCSALRLFKEGDVKYFPLRCLPGSWVPFFEGIPWDKQFIEELERSSFYWEKEYILQEDEAEEFRKFWVWFKKARQTQQRCIEVALRRFNFGYQREMLDDKLLDWMIAFEALLLVGERNKRYRLASRASCLLGKDAEEEERKEIFDALCKAYEQRNKIVHEGVADTSELGNLVSKVEDYLRSAIIEFMKRVEEIESKPHAQGKRDLKEQILKALDDQIARGDCSIPPNRDEEG